MWYAIEYAYGSATVNNGNRPDRVYEFTRRELRDAWVSAGAFQGAGERATIDARQAKRAGDPRERIDGDVSGWEVIARNRVDASPNLARYRETIIDYDWGNPDHWAWVATASEREIVVWAKDALRWADTPGNNAGEWVPND